MRGRRARGFGGLENVFQVLPAACDAFFWTYGAPQTSKGTALCSHYRYSAYGAIHLPFSVTKSSAGVLTRFAARLLL